MRVENTDSRVPAKYEDCPRYVSSATLPKFVVLVGAAVALVILTCVSCEAANSSSKLVIVVAGNLSIRDIVSKRLRNLSTLFKEGSAALMNVRTGRPSKLIEPVDNPGMESGCLTIGAGAMATGGAEVRRAAGVVTPLNYLNSSFVDGTASSPLSPLQRKDKTGTYQSSLRPQLLSTASDLWKCRTGWKPGSAQIVHTEIVKIGRINSTAAYRAKPGFLGSELRAAGVKTAVVGNSTIPGEWHCEAVAIAMDRMGLVDCGKIDSPDFTLRDQGAPFGTRSNLEMVVRELDRVLEECRFVVVDFGDTYRVDRYAELCTENQSTRLRESAIARLDYMIGRVSARLDFEKDTLVLLSPSPRISSDIDYERLTPILIRGPGFKGGMLTSPSTRRTGVVTICDVAPTVLAFFGLKVPPGMIGRPVSAVSHTSAAEALLKLNLEAIKQAQRQVAMRGASVVQSAVVVLATAALIFGAMWLKKAAVWAALISAAIPLAMLYAPAVYSGGLWGTVALLFGLTVLVLTGFGVVLRQPMRAFVWLCVVIVSSILVDLARGAPLISSSVAGYNLTEGARYYGLGNELMGTLIGATIMGTGAVLRSGKPSERRNRWGRKFISPLLSSRGEYGWEPTLSTKVILFSIFLLVFFFIGWPSLGANGGGAAAFAPAMAAFLTVAWGWRSGARRIALIALAGVVGIVGLFAVDALRAGGSQSHIGRMAATIAGAGPIGALEMIQRKVTLNIMLLSTSLWSRLLALSLLGAAIIYMVGARRLTESRLSRGERGAVIGCCVAVFTTFSFNDSGVLAAAACAVFLWMWFAIRYNELVVSMTDNVLAK
ncbi:MAG: hypothetical protein N3B12_01390 [Armatimonadetes bacterium]|nr:hypothetical protein [Armatimonadota bacterium]